MFPVFSAAMLLLMLVVSVFLATIFLRLGASWAKIDGVTWPRALYAALASNLVPLFVVGGFQALGGKAHGSGGSEIVLGLIQLGLQLAITWRLTAWILRTTVRRAAQAWLLQLIPAVGMIGIALVIIRPFFAEAFTMPTNGMAPTLLGPHWEGVCPECGRPTYCSMPRQQPRNAVPTAELMICQSRMHTVEVVPTNTDVHPGDHFLACKFLTPRRWDIAIFRAPFDPTVIYAQRIVGLPGEEVLIKDGGVWINGQRQEPPAALSGLSYGVDPRTKGLRLSAVDAPAKLGTDEFFVLGDFSQRSSDSRFWQQGAPGHPPYAVPASHITGVVTEIYWPPSRIRNLRD